MKRNRWQMIFWETVLLLGSIPVFRSIWMLCDRFDVMHSKAGIGIAFFIGLLLCTLALMGLNKPDKNN